MDKNNNKLEALIKLAPFIGIAICILVFIAMSQIPPSGPWVKDANVPVFPTLKYSHINEPWGKSYKREDGQPSYIPVETLNTANQLPGQAKSEAAAAAPAPPTTPFASTPRLLSFRNSPHDQSGPQNVNLSISADTPANEGNVSPTYDLLSTGYINDSKTPYNSAFGIGRNQINDVQK